MTHPIAIEMASSLAQTALVRALFVEYAGAIGVDLGYQGFDAELAALPKPYVSPDGALFVAMFRGAAVGCIALRRLGAGVSDGDGGVGVGVGGVCSSLGEKVGPRAGEIKRFYVRPAFRGTGTASRLMESAIHAARQLGYTAIKLDTLADMTAAQRFYLRRGFVEVSAHNTTHLPGTRFYELALKE